MSASLAGNAAAEPFDHDIFISYNSADRAIVKRFVDYFRFAKLRVWWDQEFNEGDWGNKVEFAITHARRVLLFVSRNSMESGYVFVEARLAREQQKLIPILIDDAKLKFQFEGLIALIDRFEIQDAGRWDDANRFDGDARLAALLKVCGAATNPVDAPAPTDLTPRDRARQWLAKVSEVDAIADALAVAVLESEPYETVLAAAEPLRKALRALTTSEERVPLSLGRLTRSRERTLHAIEARIFPMRPLRLKMDIDCVRFEEAGRGHALLNLIWEEIDELRQPLTDWLNDLAQLSDVNLRYRVAIAVGVMAQRSFPSVFESLIKGWALDRDKPARQTADLSLSVAALAPEVADAVSSVLIKDWSAENATIPQLRAAVEIACGSTGFRLAPQAISVLKRIAQRGHARLQGDASEAVGNLVALACTSDGDALFDLPTFLSALVDWAKLPGDRDVPCYVPMFLLLSALGGLLPSDPDGGPSLARLFENRRSVNLKSEGTVETALRACARGFLAMLARREVRNDAQKVLRNWARYQKEHSVDPDPVLLLARAVFALAEPGSIDRQRVEFIFRGFYPASLLGENRPQIERGAS